MYTQELYHHGIRGQKWGVRRYQNSDGSLTPEGKKRYGYATRYGKVELEKFKDKPSEIKLSPQDAKSKITAGIVSVATTAAGVGMLASGVLPRYGVYMAGLGAIGTLGTIKEAASEAKLSLMRRNGDRDKATGLMIKKKDKGSEFDLKHSNPAYSKSKYAYNAEDSRRNCACCSIAYDMRRRGFEVVANKTERGLTSNQIQSMYKNAKVYKITGDKPYVMKNGRFINEDLTKQVTKQMAKEPDGSRGVLMMTWSNGISGHATAYEKNNGQVYIFDAQNGKKYPVSEYSDRSRDFEYFRTDNLDINPSQIKKVVR